MNINEKSKGEQLFVLLIMFTILMGFLCITGCGGKSCETPKCGYEDVAGFKTVGCSLPGIGGCLTSGEGCNSACWPQSCKISTGCYENDENEDDKGCAVACDTKYYGGGCLGCAQSQKSCYTGCMNIESGEDKIRGFFYGSSDKGEKLIGCANGCGGCIASDGTGAYLMEEMEKMEGIY